MSTYEPVVPDLIRARRAEEVARHARRLRAALDGRDRALADARAAGLSLRELAMLSGLSIEGVRGRLARCSSS